MADLSVETEEIKPKLNFLGVSIGEPTCNWNLSGTVRLKIYRVHEDGSRDYFDEEMWQETPARNGSQKGKCQGIPRKELNNYKKALTEDFDKIVDYEGETEKFSARLGNPDDQESISGSFMQRWLPLRAGIEFRAFNVRGTRVVAVRLAEGTDVKILKVTTSLRKMIMESQPAVAINGGFTAKKRDGGGHDGLLVVEGATLAELDSTNDVLDGILGIRERSVEIITREQFVDEDYIFALQAGPLLLSDGEILVKEERDYRFAEFEKLLPWRSGVCILGSGELVLVRSEPITKYGFAYVMKRSLGCKDALNLGGSTTSGLYINKPERSLWEGGFGRVESAIMIFLN
jgi:uncharacterized protein YigE (DUF2233 family)